ncbi:MAG: BlaI/MecI/CopY family transcriptional regulator [Candidatus Obscuribacterales bacterium]|nr:BlaI/MecI/CopY family transcriptional regulator [Candidatus Obscuribacterales bacterium]
MRLDDINASFRFNQKGLRKFLGDLEVDIMELVWKSTNANNSTVKVREIYELLRRQRDIAYTTVMTTMVRLAEKGILRIVDKAGLANCYAPEKSKEEFIAGVVDKVLGIFLDEFPNESNEFLSSYKPRAPKKSSGSKKR